jgi:glutamyl-Q tRNA(Asp) synthetase
MSDTPYCGRFAPSPTGNLHFGSLVAAVASHADARHHGGGWLLRIEDVDETRTRPGSEERILAALEAFGMPPDDSPVRQSERVVRYDEALERLVGAGLAYRCQCSRKTVAAMARAGRDGPIYPGTCRRHPPDPATPAAWRLCVGRESIDFGDRVFGPITQDLEAEVGDFVIRRIDGFTAYQLAVVVDDADQGITDVVRGADLLWSTPRQILLQRLLGLPTPRYAHVPLVCDARGRKLSKRDAAHPVDPDDPLPALRAAWRHLGQADLSVRLRSSREFWQVAVAEWSMDQVRTRIRQAP